MGDAHRFVRAGSGTRRSAAASGSAAGGDYGGERAGKRAKPVGVCRVSSRTDKAAAGDGLSRLERRRRRAGPTGRRAWRDSLAFRLFPGRHKIEDKSPGFMGEMRAYIGQNT